MWLTVGPIVWYLGEFTGCPGEQLYERARVYAFLAYEAQHEVRSNRSTLGHLLRIVDRWCALRLRQ
eukprot:7153736-Prymnesium_polylepis.1